MLYRIVKKIKWILRPIFMWVKCDDTSAFKREGAYIICCNHVHALDPVVLADINPRKISFMAKKELFHNKIASWFLHRLYAFPVNREGNDISAIKTALKRLKEGWALGIFPEGKRALTDDMTPFHSGAAMLALRTKTPVIPVAIDRRYRLFFQRIYVKVGEPMYFSDLLEHEKVGEKEYEIATQRIEDEVYRLRQEARKDRNA